MSLVSMSLANELDLKIQSPSQGTHIIRAVSNFVVMVDTGMSIVVRTFQETDEHMMKSLSTQISRLIRPVWLCARESVYAT